MINEFSIVHEPRANGHTWWNTTTIRMNGMTFNLQCQCLVKYDLSFLQMVQKAMLILWKELTIDDDVNLQLQWHAHAINSYQYINWSWKKNLKQWVVERSPGLLDHFGRVDVDVKKSDRTYMMWHHIVLSFLHTTISLLIPHIVGKVRYQLETQSSAIMSSGIVPDVSRVRWQGSHYERTLEASFSPS